jgi:ABC-type lipoprotein export system ATPase subunit
VSDETTIALEADGLSKSFSFEGGSIQVLDGAGLSVERGRSISVRGESGCGKTTLLNLLARLETADSGTLSWQGDRLDPMAMPSAREAAMRATFLGVVYQAYYLMPELNAIENIMVAARIAGQNNGEAVDRARQLLARVGMEGRDLQMPTKMSGGERQRIAIARALLNRPRVILADEPTGNLDEKTAGEVIDLLLGACREEDASLVLVTHNVAFAKTTDEALFLTKGILGAT